jgi:radical SAM superfamily enzyme YgiQ (UPF0313 family)
MYKRVLLVSPPFYKPYSNQQVQADSAPLGLGYLAAYVMRKVPDIEVKIIDYGVEPYSPTRWQNDLIDYRPDVVGINVLTLGYDQAMKLAGWVEVYDRRILTIAGGPHATVRPEECLAACDVVVRGEGELTLAEILQGKPLESIKGVSFRRDGSLVHNPERERIEDLDSLPAPSHYLFNHQAYKQYPGWGVIGSRGCAYNCIFCASPKLWGRNIKLRSPQKLVDEIEYLHNEMGITHIVFQDDAINLWQRRAMAICDEIIRRGLHRKVSFDCQVRANNNCASLELFKRMKEANFIDLTFGIETGSDKVMKSMHKSLTVREAGEAVKLARRAGISTVTGFFMVGNWGEGVLDLLKTWWFVLRNQLDMKLTVCTPLPGTEFDSLLREKGYLRRDVDWQHVDWVTPLSRTDRLPRWGIALFYFLTVLLVHLPSSYLRGRKEKTRGLVNNIFGFIAQKFRGKQHGMLPELSANVSRRSI